MAEGKGKRKLALITGATGGIGRATAIALVKKGGFDLALQYHTADERTCDALAEDLIQHRQRSEALGLHFYQADMGDYDSVRELYRNVSKMGDVDVLFCNAGTTGGHSGVQHLNDVPFDVFETTWRINTGSAILLTQLCLPHMEQQGWGRIIFCSSVAAFTGGAVGPHYASSKSAQHGFIHWLASRVASKGITVNGVAPALIGDTTMMGSSEDEQTKKRAESKCLPDHSPLSSANCCSATDQTTWQA